MLVRFGSEEDVVVRRLEPGDLLVAVRPTRHSLGVEVDDGGQLVIDVTVTEDPTGAGPTVVRVVTAPMPGTSYLMAPDRVVTRRRRKA